MRLIALAACLALTAPAAMAADLGLRPTDSAYQAMGQETPKGARMVHFYKLTEEAGRQVICVTSYMRIGNAFLAEEIAEALAAQTWVELDGRRATPRFLRNTPMELGRRTRLPEQARCYDAGPATGTTPVLDIRMPSAISVGDAFEKQHFNFHRIGPGADRPQ